MDFLRTPDERFADLPGFPFEPNYIDVGGLRMAYVDEGPAHAPVVLMLHGEPSWSYLYRKMIPPVVEAGYRAIAPDLIGFGRSDKPTARDAYSYQAHVDWVLSFIESLDLNGITLFCQDWGGLIGLRLVATHTERFARVVAANTFLPTGEQPVGKAFEAWLDFSQNSPEFDIGRVIQKGTATELSDDVVDAYRAPFPDDSFTAGARIFPALVPITPEHPGAAENKEAWKTLFALEMPFLTSFGDSDPITRGGDKFMQATIPGAKGQAHTTIENAGHFLQEDQGERCAEVLVEFIRATS